MDEKRKEKTHMSEAADSPKQGCKGRVVSALQGLKG